MLYQLSYGTFVICDAKVGVIFELCKFFGVFL